jgi:hypothetical protein
MWIDSISNYLSSYNLICNVAAIAAMCAWFSTDVRVMSLSYSRAVSVFSFDVSNIKDIFNNMVYVMAEAMSILNANIFIY